MDFSENVNGTPKFEVQDAHFSKRQFSLHCTVNLTGVEKRTYFYHLSNDTGHDAQFTFAVVDDLLSQVPEQDIYRFKSDNSSTQYKCLNNFVKWRELSKL